MDEQLTAAGAEFASLGVQPSEYRAIGKEIWLSARRVLLQ